MNVPKSVLDKLMEMFFKTPKIKKSYILHNFTFNYYENGVVGFKLNDAFVSKFFSYVRLKDNREVSTRDMKLKEVIEKENEINFIYSKDKLLVTQNIVVNEGDDFFTIKVIVKDESNKKIATNYIRVIEFCYPDKEFHPLFSSLEERMLRVPYDNDMWVKYESLYLSPGLASYELSAIYDEDSLNGLVIGALDYNNFKNGIKCSDHDARVFYGLSGIADEMTHDIKPHGYIEGESLESSRFFVGFYSDIKEGLNKFASTALIGKHKLKWNKEAIFGFNTYSAGLMTLEEWKEAADFIYNDLKNFKGKDNVTYINLDANFMLDKKSMKKIIDELHQRGQCVGNYMAPALGNKELAMISPLKGTIGAKIDDILMKDEKGNIYPKIDSGIPVDVTNPIFIKNFKIRLQEIIDMGFDYIKFDFLTHAGVEGIRYDKNITTGRQAIHFFYELMNKMIEESGRDIFIDFSISPIFPFGYAHARRASCDAFGHIEDSKYVLNALNYSFYLSGSLYEFNDPDHTVLYESKMNMRGISDFNSAKSRYFASLISGTVLLLSDNFGPYNEEEKRSVIKERVKKIANSKELNEIATFKKAFLPYEIKANTTNIYYLNNDGRNFVAIFNFKKEKAAYNVDASKINFPTSGKLKDLFTLEILNYENVITAKLDSCDAVIYEVIE